MKKKLLIGGLILLSIVLVVVWARSDFFGSEKYQDNKPSIKPGGEVTLTYSELEEAVSQAILAQEKSYAKGEAATEGHLILEIEEDERIIKVYMLAGFGSFGFENGILPRSAAVGQFLQ